MGENDKGLNKEQKKTKQNAEEIKKVVKEIIDKCNKKNIRVDYIVKVNSRLYNMEYFIAPPIKDVGGINFGCRRGYSYNSKSIFKRLKKASLGSGNFIWDNVECVYRAEDPNEDA